MKGTGILFVPMMMSIGRLIGREWLGRWVMLCMMGNLRVCGLMSIKKEAEDMMGATNLGGKQKGSSA